MSRADSKKRHEQSCQGDILHVCPQCNKCCATAQGLKRHLQWHDNIQNPTSLSSDKASKAINPEAGHIQRPISTPAQATQYRCRRCTDVFDNRHDLYLHGRREHYNQYGGALQPSPWGRNEVTPMDNDGALREVYNANQAHILENHRLGPVHSIYNFPVTNDVNLNQLMRMAQDIYRHQQRAFRLNLVFGTILQNRETGRYRYFVPYNNSGIFERPL